jgi:hypothetical protein
MRNHKGCAIVVDAFSLSNSATDERRRAQIRIKHSRAFALICADLFDLWPVSLAKVQ